MVAEIDQINNQIARLGTLVSNPNITDAEREEVMEHIRQLNVLKADLGGATENVYEKYNPDSDKVDFSGKEEKPKKSWGKAAASAFLPGLGQAIDGRWKDGAKYFAGLAGVGVLSKVLSGTAVKSLAKNSKAGLIASIGAGVLTGVAGLATYVHGIVDAYNQKNS